MPWARIDVGFLRHPDVASLTPKEQVAYLGLILYCQEHNTGGIVPRSAALNLAGDQRTRMKVIDALLAARRIVREPCADCTRNVCTSACKTRAFRVRNYTRYQPPTDAQLREKWRESKRRQRSTKPKTENVHQDTVTLNHSLSVPNVHPNVHPGHVHPYVTRRNEPKGIDGSSSSKEKKHEPQRKKNNGRDLEPIRLSDFRLNLPQPGAAEA